MKLLGLLFKSILLISSTPTGPLFLPKIINGCNPVKFLNKKTIIYGKPCTFLSNYSPPPPTHFEGLDSLQCVVTRESCWYYRSSISPIQEEEGDNEGKWVGRGNYKTFGSRKYPYPPHGWSLEILRGWGGGVSTAKNLNKKNKAKLEFPEGRGSKIKKHL